MSARLLARFSFPLITVVYAVTYLSAIWAMPVRARALPQMVLLTVLAITVWVLVDELRAGNGSASVPGDDARGRSWFPWSRSVAMIVLLGGLIVGVAHVGFYTSSTLFLLAGLVLLRVPLWPHIALLLPMVTVSIYVVFDLVLNLRVPDGTLLP